MHKNFTSKKQQKLKQQKRSTVRALAICTANAPTTATTMHNKFTSKTEIYAATCSTNALVKAATTETIATTTAKIVCTTNVMTRATTWDVFIAVSG